MSPILIRPVREQIEHDRIIRVLHARFRKDFDVETNLGDERKSAVRIGQRMHYPDLVLTGTGTPRKIQAVVEVETGESVNHLEAMAEWAHYGKVKARFLLYVPVGTVDIAKRLIEDYSVAVSELWSYAPVGDHVHFWLLRSSGDPGAPPVGTQIVASIESAMPPPQAPVPEPAQPTAPAKPVTAKAGAVKPSAAKPAPAQTAAKPTAPTSKPSPVKPTAAKPAKPETKPPAKPAAPPAKGIVKAGKGAKAPRAGAPVRSGPPVKAAAKKPVAPKPAKAAKPSKPAVKKPARPTKPPAKPRAKAKAKPVAKKASPKAKAQPKLKAKPAKGSRRR